MALIDVPSLARQLAAPDPPTVIDVRFTLGGPPGRGQYEDGHIPGAAFLDVDRELCGPPGPAGRHPLPEPAVLQVALRKAGVRTGHPVVAYDGGDGQAAARLWWTLRWAGHTEVRVLDGGFAAWTAQRRPIEPGEAEPPAGDFVVHPGQAPVLDADGAAELARTGVLLDARIGPRYRGETEPVDAVAGHIPGAVNLPAAELTAPDGLLRPAAELRQLFEAAIGAGPAGAGPAGAGPAGAGPAAAGPAGAGAAAAGAVEDAAGARPVGAYCGSGLTAAKTVLALAEAGYPDAALYVGSWSNWISDPARPIETGEGA